jgi:hypothetical protein
LNPRIAIVHDWLTTRGGSEKVLEALLGLYPEADLFVLMDFYSDEERALYNKKVPKTSFMQRMRLLGASIDSICH